MTHFEGHGGASGHHTTGQRAWCLGCAEWCYPEAPCGEARCCTAKVATELRQSATIMEPMLAAEYRRRADEMMEQPPPIPNDRPSIQQLVLADVAERERIGIERYGVALQALNGRDGLRDLYEELLDAVMYVRQLIEEDRLTRAEPES